MTILLTLLQLITLTISLLLALNVFKAESLDTPIIFNIEVHNIGILQNPYIKC